MVRIQSEEPTKLRILSYVIVDMEILSQRIENNRILGAHLKR